MLLHDVRARNNAIESGSQIISTPLIFGAGYRSPALTYNTACTGALAESRTENRATLHAKTNG